MAMQAPFHLPFVILCAEAIVVICSPLVHSREQKWKIVWVNVLVVTKGFWEGLSGAALVDLESY